MSDLQAKIEQLIFDVREGNTFESEPELAEVVMGWLSEVGYVKLDVDDPEPSAIKGEIDELCREVDSLRAELADLRASSVVVRERCRTCGGSGGCPCGFPPENGEHPCPVCDNGWQLAEGVEVAAYDGGGVWSKWSGSGRYYVIDGGDS